MDSQSSVLAQDSACFNLSIGLRNVAVDYWCARVGVFTLRTRASVYELGNSSGRGAEMADVIKRRTRRSFYLYLMANDPSSHNFAHDITMSGRQIVLRSKACES